MDKILAVIVSKDTNCSMNKDVFDANNIETSFVLENKEPLTVIYNEHLNIIRSRINRPEYVIFMHSDVSLDLTSLINHIKECGSKYDVMGLCGCEKVNTRHSPLNWFTASKDNVNYRWGCVTHGENGNTKSFFSENRSHIKDHHVGAIDGLCIIFGKKAIDSDMKFDENLKFDLYDTDISFQTLMKYNLQLGVIVEESLHHYSIGKSITTDDFLKHEIYFRNKWGLTIPSNSRIEQLSMFQSMKQLGAN